MFVCFCVCDCLSVCARSGARAFVCACVCVCVLCVCVFVCVCVHVLSLMQQWHLDDEANLVRVSEADLRPRRMTATLKFLTGGWALVIVIWMDIMRFDVQGLLPCVSVFSLHCRLSLEVSPYALRSPVAAVASR